ncbi:Type IIS restriction enzyme Eco57I [Legionella santicrucis]|uniref:site-specific DNA-methyltransferase (adenine-specific) n=1 Tax=Legionella santicrucis TaxID=45074 RepID=A0A0W0ZLJ0_9GAMM|nr:TaqI-like C-terminal specificity domain-containing protein [Legionella santicrucis]KTD69997.1 Type IIS restriction enzyme Eco57I [Legionella santicrucis]
MKKKAAIKIVENTLHNRFDEARYFEFTKNIFKKFNIVNESIISDSEYISKIELLASYTDVNNRHIDIMVANLHKTSSLERVRVGLRNTIAKLLHNSDRDAALVAYVSPSNEDWRLSLVSIEYSLNHGNRIELGTANSNTFLVGENEKCHTAQEQFVPVLENDICPTLNTISEIFSKEKVTNEFYDKYLNLFLTLKEEIDKIKDKDEEVRKEFEKKNVETHLFARKLLGQIVFLYFLQKKGWLGVKVNENWGTGSKSFLRDLFDRKRENQNFFNDILEPMLYEALRLKRHSDYYRLFDCRIPFLNSGLFDPINNYRWQNIKLLIPDELFSNKLPDKKNNIGTGILDIFDLYNFTVKEDEPLEHEVGVDPEMLGKVFEKLLEIKDRKSKCAYYTPREVVQYMCQESLSLYLGAIFKHSIPKREIEQLIKLHISSKAIQNNAMLIDEILKNISICDPAVGSGEFLIGIMHEIVNLRLLLTRWMKIDDEHSSYNLKFNTIQNCLFGVDIDQGAVEIARLRLWLSLVVDEVDIKQVKPLPNLDYKVVLGDSLLNVKDKKLEISLLKKLKNIKLKYFNENQFKIKKQYQEEILELINKITNGIKKFDFEAYFSEVFEEKKGFDIVIANPPYKIVYDDHLKEQLEEIYPTFKRNNDISIAFYECGLNLLAYGGVLTYISSNTFLNGDYFKDFRKLLTKQMVIKEILDFKESRIFEDPTVFVCTISCQKQKEIEFPYEYCLNTPINSFSEILKNKVSIKEPSTNNLKVDNSLYLKLMNLKNVRQAKEILHIKDVGFNYWTKGRGKQRGGDSIGNRVFYSGNLKDKRDIPFLKGRNIFRYYIKETTNFLKHNFESYLNPEKDTFRFTKSLLETNPKIIYRQTANKIIATLDTSGYYLDRTVHLIAIKDKYSQIDIKYILGLLNSSLFNYLYADIAQEGEKRTFAQVKTTYLKRLPIKFEKSEYQESLIALVDKIMEITKAPDYLENPIKIDKVHTCEKQINILVYKIYSLTPEEIKVVELSNNLIEHSKKSIKKKRISAI